MKQIVIFVFALVFVSCENNIQCNHEEGCNDIIGTTVCCPLQAKELHKVRKASYSIRDKVIESLIDTLSFFGKPVVMDDQTNILQQIRMIASKDKHLTFTADSDKHVLTVRGVGFGLNIYGKNTIALFSSTPVDDPRIKSIVKYLNGFYGEATEEEPDHYWWHNRKPHNRHFMETIRLRSIHGSEDGGSTLMFYIEK